LSVNRHYLEQSGILSADFQQKRPLFKFASGIDVRKTDESQPMLLNIHLHSVICLLF